MKNIKKVNKSAYISLVVVIVMGTLIISNATSPQPIESPKSVKGVTEVKSQTVDNAELESLKKQAEQEALDAKKAKEISDKKAAEARAIREQADQDALDQTARENKDKLDAEKTRIQALKEFEAQQNRLKADIEKQKNTISSPPVVDTPIPPNNPIPAPSPKPILKQ
jgi:hypothetical protein